MLRKDLATARKNWLVGAEKDGERAEREQSDFLVGEDSEGHHPNFHALRHTFGTNLDRSGVHPKQAQELMRHSDINLTMQTYTHVGIYDLNSVLEALPALPDSTSENFACPSLVPNGTEFDPEMNRNDVFGESEKPTAGKQKLSQTPSFEGVCEGLEGDDRRAAGRIRTADLRITNASLCQLSYSGVSQLGDILNNGISI